VLWWDRRTHSSIKSPPPTSVNLGPIYQCLPVLPSSIPASLTGLNFSSTRPAISSPFNRRNINPPTTTTTTRGNMLIAAVDSGAHATVVDGDLTPIAEPNGNACFHTPGRDKTRQPCWVGSASATATATLPASLVKKNPRPATTTTTTTMLKAPQLPVTAVKPTQHQAGSIHVNGSARNSKVAVAKVRFVLGQLIREMTHGYSQRALLPEHSPSSFSFFPPSLLASPIYYTTRQSAKFTPGYTRPEGGWGSVCSPSQPPLYHQQLINSARHTSRYTLKSSWRCDGIEPSLFSSQRRAEKWQRK